jgi:hypothetical protein
MIGNFINPVLDFDYPELKFKYLWEKGVVSMPIPHDLRIFNKGPLSTSINLKID